MWKIMPVIAFVWVLCVSTGATAYPTFNWAGYQVENYVTGTLYWKVQGQWTVPAITYGPSTINSTQIAVIWVGIGNGCNFPNPSAWPLTGCPGTFDDTLIQIGTQVEVAPKSSKSGKVTGSTPIYSAFYQAWTGLPKLGQTNPPPPQLVAYGYPQLKKGVHAGDKIEAGLHCVSNCTGSPQGWEFWMKNFSTGDSWVSPSPLVFPSNMLLAEWIVEAPSGNACPWGIYPLPNFDTVSISPGVNDTTPDLGQSALTTSAAIWWTAGVPYTCGDQGAISSQAGANGSFRVCYVPPNTNVGDPWVYCP